MTSAALVRALTLATATALVVGCPGEPPRGGDALAALDPSVRRVAGLELEGQTLVQSTWFKGATLPLALVRGLRGWETIEGAPCARFGLAVLTKEDEGDVSTEWLRPAGDRVLCPARALGSAARQVLAPPQPVLVAPLEPGQTWRWEGTVDGVPASVDFRVKSVGERDLAGERRFAVELEHVIRAAGFEATRVQTWAEGRGLVFEEGVLPSPDVGDAPDAFRAWVGAAQ